MKKFFSSLSREGVQKLLFIGVLVMVFGVFFVSLYLSSGTEKPTPNDPTTPSTPEDPEKPDDPKPAPEKFRMPVSSEYVIVRKYYEVEAEVADQELAVIQFGSKYFLSKGLSLSSKSGENFDVVASLSGTVMDVSDSSVYGKTVMIEHEDGVVTEYISLSEVLVAVGDSVAQGDKIGVSGTNEYDVLAANHVHFRVSKNGEYYNPELLVDKQIDDM